MRTKKFIYNTFWTALLNVFILLSGFIIPRYIITTYGSEVNGLVLSITHFINYLLLVEAGLASAAIYALFKPLAEKNKANINSVLSATRIFYNQIGLVFLSLVVILAIIYPLFVDTILFSYKDLSLLVLVIGANGAINFFTMSKYRVLLSADQRVYVISIASIVYYIFFVSVVIFLAKFKVDIVLIQASAVLAITVRSIILSSYVKLKYKSLDYYYKPDKKALNKRWDALYLQLLGNIQISAPLIIATFFTSLSTISVFAIYNLMMVGINSLLSIFISGLSSSFGEVLASKNKEVFIKAYREFELAYYTLISIVYSSLYVIFIPFINLYTDGITDTNYIIPFLAFLMIFNGLLFNIKTPQGMLIKSAGLFKETRVQTTIQGVIALVGGVILVQFWGLFGIVIALILSNIYRVIDLVIFVPKKINGIDITTSVKRIIRVFIVVPLSILPFQFIKLDSSSWLPFLWESIFVFTIITTIILIYTMIRERKDFNSLVLRLKHFKKTHHT